MMNPSTLFTLAERAKMFLRPDGTLRMSPPERRDTRVTVVPHTYISGRELETWPSRVDRFRQRWVELTESEQLGVLLTAYPDGYVEMPPFGPQPGGDVGGDTQVGDAWSRRFAHKMPDKTIAVVEISVYVDNREGDDGGAGPVLMRETGYTRCANPFNPGATEVWADYRYESFGGQPDPEQVRDVVWQFDPSEIVWDGEPFAVRPATLVTT